MSSALDRANEEFWNELCGSSLARRLGIKTHSRQELERFDQAYLDFYPYLLGHVHTSEMRQKKVMDVGLGYGTLGQEIIKAGSDYVGLDIADQPVRMMKHRIRMTSLHGNVVKASILDCPVDSESVDWVISIGCFHHTGDIQRCVDETYRVLKPGGQVTIMAYNRFSLRQWVWWPAQTFQAALSDLGLQEKHPEASEDMRRFYDSNLSGSAAPETQFSSLKQLRKVFRRYSQVRFYKENCDSLVVPKLHITVIPRLKLLSSVGRAMGTDIYVEARKQTGRVRLDGPR